MGSKVPKQPNARQIQKNHNVRWPKLRVKFHWTISIIPSDRSDTTASRLEAVREETRVMMNRLRDATPRKIATSEIVAAAAFEKKNIWRIH